MTENGTTKSQPAAKAAPTTAASTTATPKAASTPSEATAKPEGSPPKNYSRGEGQKPVTDAYKENWNRIYGKKKRSK
jgi:hypothetical protein